MKIHHITDYLEQYAPLSYQESYDNSGLLVGDRHAEIHKALVCLDMTESVIDEAIQIGAGLVIAHHPIIFSGLKKLTGKSYVDRVVIKAIKNNIALYAIHTNLDNMLHGVNEEFGERLGLSNLRILQPLKNSLTKLSTFVPEINAETVRQALWHVGAGNIGNYDSCSFNTSGIGTYRANKGANPSIGQIGTLHQENEIKVEVIFPNYIQYQVVMALVNAHPYEEVAYDLIPLNNQNLYIGAGMIGSLPHPTPVMDFLHFIKEIMQTGCVKYTSIVSDTVQKIAICGGSGSFLIQDAIAQGADMFITSDIKYHQFFDADGKIMLVDIGHYETEQFTSEKLIRILNEKFPTFALLKAGIVTNPINYL